MKAEEREIRRKRFPPEIIQYAVWLYYRFNLSNRDIEDLLDRGIEGSVRSNNSPTRQTAKDDPHPQVVVAFGLRMMNVAPWRSSL